MTRTPDFTITGLRGATFEVSSIGQGQTLTRTSASTFSFSNGGINRSFTTPGGLTLLDLTTETTSNILITGNLRLGREINGGALEITNNLNSNVCSIAPSAVTWGSASCNCPTSGSFAGTCSTGESISMVFSETCGQSTITLGDEVRTITLDRCN